MISPVIFPVLLTILVILSVTAIVLRALGPAQDERAIPVETLCVVIAALMVIAHMAGGVR